jgi:glycosyltransferase involved in cell wall biosynthesis
MALDRIFDVSRIGRRRRREEVGILADRARDARQWNLAAELYRETLDRNPRNAPIWVQYGHALKEWGELREPGKLAQAEIAYRRALSLDPTEADTYLQLGHVLKLQGKTEDAKAAYLRAFALDPSAPYPPQELSGLGWSEVHTAELKRLVASDPEPHSSIKSRGVPGGTAHGNEQKFLTEEATTESTQSLLRVPAATLSVLAAETVDLNPLPVETNSSPAYRMEQDIRIIRESGLFDEAYYRANNRDLPEKVDLVGHFVEWGAKQGRKPNRIFDPALYLDLNPDVAQSVNPLAHFINHRNFDPTFYLSRYPDVARAGQDPLEHFLKHGMKEGRKANSDEAREVWAPSDGPAGRSGAVAVTDAEIVCVKDPSFHDEVALFVTHSPHGRLKPHVPHYLQSLRRQGIAVVLIIMADRPVTGADKNLPDAVDGLFVRRNEGYDFAAWAHVLLLRPEFFDAKILYLLNDSVIGPANDVAFAELLERLRNSPADFVGLTENFDKNWHIQSYFLALKRRALSSVALQKFICDIVSYKDFQNVIDEFEIRFAPALKSAGLICDTMFRVADSRDPTIYHWDTLLRSGFPFIKVKVIRDNFADIEVTNWGELLAAQGYDVSLAERTVAGEVGLALPNNSLISKDRQPLLVSAALSPTVTRDAKIAFIGPWNYDNGLGVASRGYITALRSTRLPVNFHPIRKPFHIHRQVAPAVDVCDFSGTADVSIVHLNPDAWPGLLGESEMAVIERANVRIGLWVWEMAQIPKNWYPYFDRVDRIWTPSRYCAEIFSGKSQAPVDVIPHVVAVDPLAPDPVRSAAVRQELGMSADDRIILYAFDGSSYLVRKNPFALVHSFAWSRLAEKGWRLVLKTKHLFDSPAQGELLRQEVDRAHGVVLVDRAVDKAAMRALMQEADIFASPHCSEGFGQTIAEAMAMGKIVIATDYGGSRDFLDARCGFPVRYRLCSLDRDHGHYTRDGGVWAQIDETHLGEAMIEASQLVTSGDTRLGDAARHRINDLCSPAAVGATMHSSICRLLSAH